MFKAVLLFHLVGSRGTGFMKTKCPVLTLAFSPPYTQQGRTGAGRQGEAADVPANRRYKTKEKKNSGRSSNIKGQSREGGKKIGENRPEEEILK